MIRIDHAMRSVTSGDRIDDRCGDYFFQLDRRDDQIVLFGDVGGHGNKEVFLVAQAIIEVIKSEPELKITEYYKRIASLSGVEKLGTTLFIGQFYKNLPLLQYLSVGNVRLLRYSSHSKSFNKLPNQKGIVGILGTNQPHVYTIKLHTNDQICGFTDGISSDIYSYLITQQKDPFDVNSAAGFIEEFSKGDDDALAVIIDVHYTSQIEMFRVPNKTLTPKPERTVIWQEESPEPLAQPLEPSNPAPELNIPIAPLSKGDLFAVLSLSPTLKEKLTVLFAELTFPVSDRNRLIMVILEILNQQSTTVSVYIDEQKLQFQTPISHRFYYQVLPLFPAGQRFYDETKGLLILEFRLAKPLTTNSEQYTDLQNMFKFGLDAKAYQELKQNQHQDKLLSEQNKLAAMGEMLGAIAHQWRQPINELSLNIQSLQLSYLDEEIDDEFIANFVNNNVDIIEHMSATIDDFRNFFRTDQAKELIDVQEAIVSVLNLQKAQFQASGISVEVQGDACNIMGYKSEFQQVLINLLSNAKDALISEREDDRHILITTGLNRLAILDNGGGIPDTVIERIFDPYFTTKPHGKGTGIGLYMCRQIIEDKLGGTITVTNQTWAHGRGAQFELHLV